MKDEELFDVEAPDSSEPSERGFADVWKKGCFAWEYKGKKKNHSSPTGLMDPGMG